MLVLAAVVAGLAAWPAGAWAAITIDAVRLHHVTNPPFSPSSPAVSHVSSPPGGVMHARADVTITGGSIWRATRVVWTPTGEEGRAEVDCADHAANRTSSVEPQFGFTLHPTFDRASLENTARGPSAPRFEGEYSVSFYPSMSDDCTSGVNLQGGVTNAGTVSVTPPDPNENLALRCGIDVMLVLDESGSIDRFGATDAVKGATEAFLAALVGTGSRVAITEFSSNARPGVGYTTVTAPTLAAGGVFRNYIDSFNPSGWTNWQDAFSFVRQENAEQGGIRADLVVFVTDGDPTARRTSGTVGSTAGVQTGLIDGSVLALQPAWEEANLVKRQGSHIFAVGVGPAVQIETSRRRLAAVTGYNEFPDPVDDFSRADYTVEPNFDRLRDTLRTVVRELCQSSVTITKEVDQGDGNFETDPGWRFTGTISTSAGGFEWREPPPPTGMGPRTATTNERGLARFRWEKDDPSATSTFNLEEIPNVGYDSVGPPQCVITQIVQPTGRRGRIRRQSVTPPLQLEPGEYATCTVQNRIRPGTIEIEKNATPESSQVFNFTGSLGDFMLVDDRTNQQSSRTFTGLTPGIPYTVSELVPDNWELIGITCDPDAAAVIARPQATITLPPGGAAVCTFHDVRIDPPPVDPPVDPPPDPDPPADTPTPPTPPEPPTLPPSTQLRIVKTLPRVARVGRRVRFRLTVRNTGSIAARGVTVVDAAPAPVALAGLRASRRPRIVRRTAIWSLGTLAPGASRTIRGTVRLQAARPGRLRNVALAGAANARVATAQADTRIRGARQPRVPPVTGRVPPVTG
jgi:uncharacterized repeat protein (TIGR01451 family)